MANRTVTVFLRAVTAQYQTAMARAQASAAQFGASATKAGEGWTASGKKIQGVGREMSRVGSTMSRNVSLPLAALGAGALKTAIDFESAFTGVRKTIDATESQYRELERGIQDMAERLPASVEEISAVAEAAGQLGIKREAILGFTETMIDLGESTNLTADVAATSLARLANITGMSQRDFDKLGSTIVDLGNKGASTEAEITEMGLRIAGAGKQIGLSEPQILGFAESLSSVGINAEAGGSAISRVFITMATEVAKGKDGLAQFAAVAGTTSADFKRQFETDAAGATVAFIEGLARIKKEGGNVFKVLEDLGLNEIRVRDALLRASGASKLFARSQETANAAWRENNALAKESDKRYETNAAKLEVLKNKFRNVLATFGKDLMPVFTDVMEVLSDLAKSFGEMDPEMRKNIIKWGALAMAAGPLVRIFGGITTSIGTILRTAGGAASLVGKIFGAGRGAPTTMPGTPGAPGGKGLGLLGPLAVVGGAAIATKIGMTIAEDKANRKEILSDAERIRHLYRLAGDGVDQFSDAMNNSQEVTKKQAEKLATMFGAVNSLSTGLSTTEERWVANLLAMGDVSGALDILEGHVDEAARKSHALGKGFDDAGADMAEAALKADRVRRSIEAIPNQKTIRITVYQDTVSKQIIQKVAATGSGKTALGEDPTITATKTGTRITQSASSPSTVVHKHVHVDVSGLMVTDERQKRDFALELGAILSDDDIVMGRAS